MTGSFEASTERLCREKIIPGLVLVAGDRSGDFKYAKSFGYHTLKDPSKLDTMPLDSTMWLASCTKLMTTVAAMQSVERGQVRLDDDVTTILPELKGLEILTGFDEGTGKPILISNNKPITLRHLLTHSSGLGYDVFNPILGRYQKWMDVEPDLGSDRPIPLLFAPGDGWEYGVGIDWAGRIVERLNGNISLEEYLQNSVWAPLGMKDFSFHPSTNPSVAAKLAGMGMRKGGLIPEWGYALDPKGEIEYTSQIPWDSNVSECNGGAGGYGSPFEYQKLLQSLCCDDGKVLKSETVTEMFTPQLSKKASDSINAQMKTDGMRSLALPLHSKVSFGIGGLINLEDTPGRKAGSLCWSGYPGLLWWIDRVGGLCGILGSQLLPPGDLETDRIFFEWEQEMYKRMNK